MLSSDLMGSQHAYGAHTHIQAKYFYTLKILRKIKKRVTEANT